MWWSTLSDLALTLSLPGLLLFWWWVRGLRTGVFVFPYFLVDRRRRRIEYRFWLVIGLVCWLTSAAILLAVLVWSACCGPRFVLATGLMQPAAGVEVPGRPVLR